MKRLDTVRSAFWALGAHPARTGALVLALAAGIAATTFVASIIGGFSKEIDRLAFGAYPTALVIRENAFIVDRHGPPRLTDARQLVRKVEGATAYAAWVKGEAEVWRGGESLRFDVYGVAGRYLDELDSPIAAGRYLSVEEANGETRKCLVGHDLARAMDISAPPQTLQIRGVNCEIVGVLAAARSRPAGRYANAVIAPFAVAQRYLLDREGLAPGEVDWITLFMPRGANMDEAEIETDMALRSVRGAPQSRPSPFSYGDPNATLEQQRTQRDLLTRLLLTVAALSLFASLVAYGGMAGAALASRHREVALRMAAGATGRDIRSQVTVEFLLSGLGAGVLGLGAGVLLAAVSAKVWNWPMSLSPAIAIWSVLLGLSVGLVVGVVLAGRAAGLPPSLAART